MSRKNKQRKKKAREKNQMYNNLGFQQPSYQKQQQATKPLELVFSPLAWLRLQYACHSVDTEVCAFGVTGEPDEPLYVTELLIPKQECNAAYADPDMEHVAELLEDFVPDTPVVGHSFAGTAIWMHTHPCNGATPSSTDEDTFASRTGSWALMFILARGGQMSCRIRVRAPNGFALSHELPVSVNWAAFPELANATLSAELIAGWRKELDERVCRKIYANTGYYGYQQGNGVTVYSGNAYDLSRLPARYQPPAPKEQYEFDGYSYGGGFETDKERVRRERLELEEKQIKEWEAEQDRELQAAEGTLLSDRDSVIELDDLQIVSEEELKELEEYWDEDEKETREWLQQ